MFLVKDHNLKSGMTSPFQYNNFWKDKDHFPMGSQSNPNDEFLDMYQFNNHDDHKLTNMFAINNEHNEHIDSPEVGNLNSNTSRGFKKLETLVAPLLSSEITQPANSDNNAYRKRTQSDDIIVDDDDEVTSQKGGKRKFNKGLKLLSVIVKDIVVDKQSTTYKEVADIILRDTIKFENLNLNTKLEIAKEEQNIKRRVYDALNVLIAAGILIKEGKYVRKNANNKKIIVNMKRLDANTLASKIVS